MIRNGTEAWTWSSSDNAATHYQLPPRRQTGPGHDAADAGALPTTPQEAAEQAARGDRRRPRRHVDGTPSVAGRDAYQLVLTPKDEHVAGRRSGWRWTPRQHVPLRVQVCAKGAARPPSRSASPRSPSTTARRRAFAFTAARRAPRSTRTSRPARRGTTGRSTGRAPGRRPTDRRGRRRRLDHGRWSPPCGSEPGRVDRAAGRRARGRTADGQRSRSVAAARAERSAATWGTGQLCSPSCSPC